AVIDGQGPMARRRLVEIAAEGRGEGQRAEQHATEKDPAEAQRKAHLSSSPARRERERPGAKRREGEDRATADTLTPHPLAGEGRVGVGSGEGRRRCRRPHAAVPPTVSPSIRRLGWPTPTGTPW